MPLYLFRNDVRQCKKRGNKMRNTSITFRLNEQEKERLEQLAAAKDIPLSQLVRELIKDAIQKEDK